jgi:REP-associated tyrosine transposase
MPRSPRVAPGGYVYHVLNRANGRLPLFRTPRDFLAFHDALDAAMARHPTRLLAWCVMGNHWHFVAHPRADGELSRFFAYLGLTHATRWQVAHRAVGTGHVYQARFKSFMIQEDAHLASVLRYVERNPLRAGLVDRAEDWPWGSLHARLHDPARCAALLSEWPIARPRDWVARVNRAQSPAEEEAIARSIGRGRPLGGDDWVRRVAQRFDLQSTLRDRGRPTGWRKGK